jgi:hypothetical protein
MEATIVITLLLGIAASLFTEVATAINKVISGTVLKGDGAFILAFGIAFIAAVIDFVTTPGFTLSSITSWGSFVADFGQIFTISQIFFFVIYQKLGLDINSDGQVVGPASTTTSATITVTGSNTAAAPTVTATTATLTPPATPAA